MAPSISGKTRLAGIIGWPLDHTLSPAMHNAAYEALGADWVYVPMPVEDDTAIFQLLGALRVLPFVGFNVTMPYKGVMLELCDEVAMFAQMAGAVNTVHVSEGRFIGYNTDGRGLLESLEAETGFKPEGKRVALLGAGGAAGAALVAFVLGKAASVTVVNRTIENAEALVDRVRPNARVTEVAGVSASDGSAEKAVREADVIVNATSVGMKGDETTPIPAEWIAPNHVVCDMVYRPGETPLVAASRTAGATAVDGLGMLVAQGATAIDIWGEGMQARAPRDVMRAAAAAAMSAGNGAVLE